jgi:hypothetical protein
MSATNRWPIVAGSSADRRPKKANSRRIVNPLDGINLRTRTGRAIRDLYRARLQAIEPTDDINFLTALRRAVELTVIAERIRARMLASGEDDPEFVRVENMLNRAERRVTELTPEPEHVPWWQQQDDQEETDGKEGEEEGSNSHDDH